MLWLRNLSEEERALFLEYNDRIMAAIEIEKSGRGKTDEEFLELQAASHAKQTEIALEALESFKGNIAAEVMFAAWSYPARWNDDKVAIFKRALEPGVADDLTRNQALVNYAILLAQKGEQDEAEELINSISGLMTYQQMAPHVYRWRDAVEGREAAKRSIKQLEYDIAELKKRFRIED